MSGVQAPANFGAFETLATNLSTLFISTTTTPFIYSPVVYGRYYLSTSGVAASSVPPGLSTSIATALPIPATYPGVGK